MAATFDPTLAEPRDRIRKKIGDVAAPFRWQDETIAAVYDPIALTHGAGEKAETLAAIDLLEDAPATERLSSIKQGSTSRTFATNGPSDSDRLARLRSRLAELDLTGDSSFVAVVDIEAPMADAYRTPGHCPALRILL